MKNIRDVIFFSLFTTILMPVCAFADPLGIDPQILMQMQETIRQQQEQLKKQAETLQELQKQINALQKLQSNNQTDVATGVVAVKTVKSAAPLSVSSGNDRVYLAISGQINRAMNITNDGKSTKIYHVDNDASNSRVRFVGSAKINNDLGVGTRLEVSIAPDESSLVSQNNQAPGNYFNQRWAEISLTSKRYGKLSIGKGDTASNCTAESDLSKTDLIQYSGVADISSGMFFREKNGTGNLTAVKVSDAFNSGDGLSRQSRLRYDTPSFYGFSLAGSLVTNQSSDIALTWGGEGYGFKGTGAFALSNPKLPASSLLYDGSFALLNTATGLNLVISGALLEKMTQKDRTNLYAKLGWLANLTSFGYTALGIDYTRTENAAASGDRATSVGAAVVQAFEKYATELYLQYRIYSLERATGNQPVANMNVGTFGARVKF
jgi:hypothetical protein